MLKVHLCHHLDRAFCMLALLLEVDVVMFPCKASVAAPEAPLINCAGVMIFATWLETVVWI